jgi:hypothetical protein
MPKYSKSIIYKLECKDLNVTEIYIGSTTDFYTRKSNHKMRCINKDGKFEHNTPVYCFMRLHGGWDNWQMIQIEEVNARNKRHLNQIEAKYIKDLKAELNCVIPQDIDEGLDKKEWNKEYRAKNNEKIAKKRAEKEKEYYAKNREKIAERHKEYYAKNREKIAKKEREYRAKNCEKIAEKKREYRAKNAEKFAERHKQYRAKNREKLAEKGKVKVKCPCGLEITKSSLSKHRKTIKHKDWENLPEPNLVFVD